MLAAVPHPPASAELCYQPRLFVSLSFLVSAPLRATWSSPWLLSAVIKCQCVLIVQKRHQSHGPHALSRPWPTRPQHGEVLPLKIVTYAAVSLSLAALLVAFVLLALVRTLRSNLNGIHRNLIAALFSSQLVFVIGIAQTENLVRTLPLPGRTQGPTFLQGWSRRGPLTRSWGRAACLRPFPGMGEAGESGGKLGTQAQHVGVLLCPRQESPCKVTLGAKGSVRVSAHFPDPDAL